jgi:hypothetical protein
VARDTNYKTKEAKFERFKELMGDARGSSRATFFRLCGKLQKAGRLNRSPIAPILLGQTRPPEGPLVKKQRQKKTSKQKGRNRVSVGSK